jgi:predicted DNA-binding protein
MTPPRPPQPRHVRYRVRHQARLDPETHATLEELAAVFHRKRSAILRHVMQWGLTQTNGWIINQSIPTIVHTVAMLVERELLQQVQDAADSHGMSMAAWMRQAMREVTTENFPASWRPSDRAIRSHESSYYSTRFMLRLDRASSRKLETLKQTFDRPAAEIVRALIARVTLDDFPASWHLAVEERRGRQGRRDTTPTREETTP